MQGEGYRERKWEATGPGNSDSRDQGTSLDGSRQAGWGCGRQGPGLEGGKHWVTLRRRLCNQAVDGVAQSVILDGTFESWPPHLLQLFVLVLVT